MSNQKHVKNDTDDLKWCDAVGMYRRRQPRRPTVRVETTEQSLARIADAVERICDFITKPPTPTVNVSVSADDIRNMFEESEKE